MLSVERILSEIRPETDFSTSRDFIADGLLDSFDLIQLVHALEMEHGVSIGGDDIVPENFVGMESIAALVQRSPQKREAV